MCPRLSARIGLPQRTDNQLSCRLIPFVRIVLKKPYNSVHMLLRRGSWCKTVSRHFAYGVFHLTGAIKSFSLCGKRACDTDPNTFAHAADVANAKRFVGGLAGNAQLKQLVAAHGVAGRREHQHERRGCKNRKDPHCVSLCPKLFTLKGDTRCVRACGRQSLGSSWKTCPPQCFIFWTENRTNSAAPQAQVRRKSVF